MDMFQFLLIFRKAKAGELDNCSGLLDLYSQLNEIDVDEVGVGGASKFFQAKVCIMLHVCIIVVRSSKELLELLGSSLVSKCVAFIEVATF